MDLTTVLQYIILPLVAILGKLIYDRLARIENKAETSISESEVRQILADKLGPIEQSLNDIKQIVLLGQNNVQSERQTNEIHGR